MGKYSETTVELCQINNDDYFFQESSETFILINPPSSPFVDVEQSGENQFVAAGIHLTVLEPMRRWRILFNGMLKYVDLSLISMFGQDCCIANIVFSNIFRIVFLRNLKIFCHGLFTNWLANK